MTCPQPPGSPWHQNYPRCARSPSAPSQFILTSRYIEPHPAARRPGPFGSDPIGPQCLAQARRDGRRVPVCDRHTHVRDRCLSAEGPTLARRIHPLDAVSEAERRRPHMVHPDRDLGVLKSLEAVEPSELGLAQHGISSPCPQRRVPVADRLHEGAHRLVTPAEIPHVENNAERVDLKETNIHGVPKTVVTHRILLPILARRHATGSRMAMHSTWCVIGQASKARRDRILYPPSRA